MKSNPSGAGKPSVPIPGSKRGLKGFFAETAREMHKVQWPTGHETTRLTGVVLTVCALITITLVVLGVVFEQIITFLITGKP